ncbi:MAG TPA: heavy-metal-associated domain-containing protein [Anaerolineales bacterium]|nr:heavy-metal-associated domain-containing protein [Anaerolineales bacterium]
MERLTLTLPALYGDHHVAPVGRALSALDGVAEVVIHPAAHSVSLQFDPSRQTAATIESALASIGYTAGDPERALPAAGPAAPRHTAALAGTMSFAHEAPRWEGRPLWPCPGFDRAPIPED